MTPSNLILEALEAAVWEALRNWGTLDNLTSDPLAHLLLVREQRKSLPADSPTASRLATNEVLLGAVKEIEKQNSLETQILKLRFMEGEKIDSVALKVRRGSDQVRRLQKRAIEQLAAVIWKKEIALRQTQAEIHETALSPSTYTTLYGVEEAQRVLVEQLLRNDTPWVIALVGMGGIGKTALADALARQVIRHFHYERILWLRVTALHPTNQSGSPEQTLNRLLSELGHRLVTQLPIDMPAEQYQRQVRHLLKAAPYLMVIDNLEDEADTAYLLAHLHDLANPSKFLLTTRTRPPIQSGTFAFYLRQLPAEDAAQLIRHQAQETGLPDLATASDEQIQTIYEVVGGNPLALKLVVGLASALPLMHILQDLMEARSQEVTGMYRHIYAQAWHSLRPESQELLKMMPLADDMGAQPEQMAVMSGLAQEQLWAAISELTRLSLLEVRGTTWERRYGIHQLTRSFLLTDIIGWPEAI